MHKVLLPSVALGGIILAAALFVNKPTSPPPAQVPAATATAMATAMAIIDDAYLSAIYGNWAVDANGCTRDFRTFSPNTFGQFLWSPEMDQARMPSTRVSMTVTYLVRGRDILMAYRGDDGYQFLQAYRLTSKNTMQILEIRKRDGTTYTSSDKRIPDIATVSTAVPLADFVKCGDEAIRAMTLHP